MLRVQSVESVESVKSVECVETCDPDQTSLNLPHVKV